MSRRPWVGMGTMAMCIAAAHPVRAEDLTELQSLLEESVVTTASKSAETGTAAPATSSVVTAEQLRIYGITTLSEALDYLSLGVVTSNDQVFGQIGARGVVLTGDRGSHFLLLLDGHAVNEQYAGGTRFGRASGIPMELIDHIEMILGPGSVLYGSGAMFGVVNVITKRASNFSGTHVVAEAELITSGRAALAGGYEFPILGTRGEITYEIEYYRQRGPSYALGPQRVGNDPITGEPERFTPNRLGTGVWVGRDRVEADVPTGVLHFQSGNFELGLRATSFHLSSPTNTRNIDPSDQFIRERWASFDARYAVPVSAVVQLSGRVYGDLFDSKEVRELSQFYACPYVGATCNYDIVNNARSAGAELSSSFDWWKDKRLVTLLGVDGRTRVTSARTEARDHFTGNPLQNPAIGDPNTGARNGIFNNRDALVGAYAQQTWRAMRWLSLNGGARLDWAQQFDSVLSPRLAATGNLWHGGTLKLIYATAYRTPSPSEQHYESVVRILPERLAPERVRSVEAVVEQKLGAQRFSFGIFRSDWSELIELYRLSIPEKQVAIRDGKTIATDAIFIPIDQYRNITTVQDFGYNTSYDGSLVQGRLRFGANLTGAFASRNDPVLGPRPLSVTPQLFGNVRISYDLQNAFPTLALAVHGMSRRWADRSFGSGFSPTPYAEPLFELRVTVAGKIVPVPGLSYRFTSIFATAERGPHVIGPLQAGSSANPTPELVPLDRLRVLTGLQYDF